MSHSAEPHSVLVVMALEIEGQGVFESAGIPLLYTGVGKVNAAYHLTRRLVEWRRSAAELPRVLNIGTAGSGKFPVGALVSCAEFVQRDMDATALGFEHGATPFDPLEKVLRFPQLFPNLPQGVCGSGDHFETYANDERCDVYDMEAYALARVCKLEGAQFASVKFISDGANEDSARVWQENLARAATHWLELYEQALRA